MAKLYYKNPNKEANIFIKLMKVNSMINTQDAIDYSDTVELAYDPEGDDPVDHTFIVGERGYFAIFTSDDIDDDPFVYDDDFGIHALNFAPSNRPNITGYNIIESASSVMLKFFMSDDDNAATEFNKLVFELNYAFIKPEANWGFNYSETRSRAHSAIKSAYPYAKSILELTVPPEALIVPAKGVDTSLDDYNKAVVTDPLYHQHRLYFMGDTVVLPKNLDTTGLELIFRLRASYIDSREGFKTVSGTFQTPLKDPAELGAELELAVSSITTPQIAFLIDEGVVPPNHNDCVITATRGTFDIGEEAALDLDNWIITHRGVLVSDANIKDEDGRVHITYATQLGSGTVTIQAKAACFSDYDKDSNVISYKIVEDGE